MQHIEYLDERAYSLSAVFIRFAVRRRDRDSGVEAGALQAAYALRDDPDVAISDREALGELLRWLETHLETPERFNRTRSKGLTVSRHAALRGSRIQRPSISRKCTR